MQLYSNTAAATQYEYAASTGTACVFILRLTENQYRYMLYRYRRGFGQKKIGRKLVVVPVPTGISAEEDREKISCCTGTDGDFGRRR